MIKPIKTEPAEITLCFISVWQHVIIDFVWQHVIIGTVVYNYSFEMSGVVCCIFLLAKDKEYRCTKEYTTPKAKLKILNN